MCGYWVYGSGCGYCVCVFVGGLCGGWVYGGYLFF